MRIKFKKILQEKGKLEKIKTIDFFNKEIQE